MTREAGEMHEMHGGSAAADGGVGAGAVRLDARSLLASLTGVAGGVGLAGGADAADALSASLAAVFARAVEASVSDSVVDAALDLALSLDPSEAAPSSPRFPSSALARFELLATLAAADVTVARIIEPHLDAAAILSACPGPLDLAAIDADATSTWGVFAAEAPDVRLDAIPDDSGWLLDGTKPWCSLAGRLSHALVTARVGASGERRLFAVDLRQPGVLAHPEVWVARGFPLIPSGPTDFARVPAVPVGATGWYLERDGFEWGGVGVAACWLGGAVGIARRVIEGGRRKDDQLAAVHAGQVAASILAAASALAIAAHAIDDENPPSGAEASLLAQLTRSIVRRECEAVLRESAHALGPEPLALDAAFAARIADLDLYLRQDHGPRDEARAGRLLLTPATTHAEPPPTDPNSDPAAPAGPASPTGTTPATAEAAEVGSAPNLDVGATAATAKALDVGSAPISRADPGVTHPGPRLHSDDDDTTGQAS